MNNYYKEILHYPEIKEEKLLIKLANGLNVHFVQKKGYKQMYCAITTNFGSCTKTFINPLTNQKENIPQGVAHFIEHMLFSLDDGNVCLKFEANGLECNAYTDYLSTVFYFSGINNINNLRKGFKMLIDFVFHPHFNEKRIEQEKKIIIQEKMMYQNDPNIILEMNLLSSLYQTYPLREDILGEVEDINKITKEILEKCYNLFYIPNNMNIVIVGDFDYSDIESLIINESLLLTKNKQIKPEIITLDDQKVINKKKIKLDINVSKVAIGIKLHFKANSIQNIILNKFIYKLYFGILFGSHTYFHNRLISDEIYQGDLQKELYIDNNTCYFFITCDSLKPEKFINRVKNYLVNHKEIDEFYFNLYKKKTIGLFLSSLNNPSNIFYSMIDYLAFNEDILTLLKVISMITLEDLPKIKISRKQIKTFVIEPLNQSCEN